jgi:hypothetical protein
MELSERERATICAALQCWKEELHDGEEWIADSMYFRQLEPLSEHDVDRLSERLDTRKGMKRVREVSDSTRWKMRVLVPTYHGARAGRDAEKQPEWDRPHVPVTVLESAGLRLLLGSAEKENGARPDVQLERRPHGWALFLHPNAGDPCGCIYILDDGRTFVVPERLGATIEVVDDVPDALDGNG